MNARRELDFHAGPYPLLLKALLVLCNFFYKLNFRFARNALGREDRNFSDVAVVAPGERGEKSDLATAIGFLQTTQTVGMQPRGSALDEGRSLVRLNQAIIQST